MIPFGDNYIKQTYVEIEKPNKILVINFSILKKLEVYFILS